MKTDVKKRVHAIVALVLSLAGVLGGCAMDVAAPPATAGTDSSASPAGAPPSSDSRASSPAKPAPQVSVVPVPVAPPAPPPAPIVTAQTRQQAALQIRHAMELLDEGRADEARTELDNAKPLDPDNRTAACLLRGITADLATAVPRESTNYVVRPGDTLGRIAQRAMGDTCEFYLLARYNQIPVPKQLKYGQTIRIPGRGFVPATAAPPEAPAPRAAPATPAAEAPAPKPAPPVDDSKMRAEQHHRNALSAFRRQDLDVSIAEWSRAIELDPGNEQYRARRQEAIELKKKFERLPARTPRS